MAEETQVSVSLGSRSRRAELTPSSLIQTLASQSLSPGGDLRPRRAEVEGNAHATGDRGRGDPQFAEWPPGYPGAGDLRLVDCGSSFQVLSVGPHAEPGAAACGPVCQYPAGWLKMTMRLTILSSRTLK